MCGGGELRTSPVSAAGWPGRYDRSRKWSVYHRIRSNVDSCGGTPRPRAHQANLPLPCSVIHALDNFGYPAPHLDKTRGELRTRESNVVFQDKKQIRVSLWQDSRCAVDI